MTPWVREQRAWRARVDLHMKVGRVIHVSVRVEPNPLAALFGGPPYAIVPGSQSTYRRPKE